MSMPAEALQDLQYLRDLRYMTDEFFKAMESGYLNDQDLLGVDGYTPVGNPQKHRYSVVVTRNRTKNFGPGRLDVWDHETEEIIFSCPCFTGSLRLDPARLSGLTPPIVWCLVEPIETRDHPHIRRHNQLMGRIHPLYKEDMEGPYSDRTYLLIGKYAAPFMTHKGEDEDGDSTGCVTVPYTHDDRYFEVVNECWRANGGALLYSVEEDEELSVPPYRQWNDYYSERGEELKEWVA